ncbi:nitroreductase family protein [Dankookia sp. P2]|uniref:nitroreductase family protein n=1 Tax=Dankookia sp. P2 TaxID=3423955 RepID=UPI003D6741AB
MHGQHAPTTTQQAALAARYGAAVPMAGPWNSTIAGMLDHRSVRGYRPDALPPGTLETLVAAAQSAATSSNLQTWSVVSVEDPAARAVMAEIAGGQKHILECPLFLVFLADVGRNDRLGIEEGRLLAGMPYLETFLVAAIDAALAAQNAVVAAEKSGPVHRLYRGASQ